MKANETIVTSIDPTSALETSLGENDPTTTLIETTETNIPNTVAISKTTISTYKNTTALVNTERVKSKASKYYGSKNLSLIGLAFNLNKLFFEQ